MSSCTQCPRGVSIRVNQNYDDSYAPSRLGKCMAPLDPKEAKTERGVKKAAKLKKALVKYKDDHVIPVFDFIMDRPDFYRQDAAEPSRRRGIENATGVTVYVVSLTIGVAWSL